MPYNESAAARLRPFLSSSNVTEQKMFGGLGFLLNGNMSVGLWKEFLILRIDPDSYHTFLTQPHVKPFDITGRPLSGWLMIEPPGFATDADLQQWISLSLDYASALPQKTAAMKKKMKSKMSKSAKLKPASKAPQKVATRRKK